MTQERDSPTGGAPAGGRVLVIDDESINRDLLRGLLEDTGYEVEVGEDGVDAVRLSLSYQPDCILLDLIMPKLSGVDACREIKENPETAVIPILVITGDTDGGARIEAIKSGADDFLTKPYDPDEVLLRVKNAVRSKHLYDRVRDDLRRLQELEQTKEDLTHMLIHDLRQPLSGIKAHSDYLIFSEGDNMAPLVEESLQRITRLVSTAESMIANILDITRLEDGHMPIESSAQDLQTIVAGAVEDVQQYANNAQVELELRPAPCVVSCDPELIRRIAVNLLSNAIKFSKQGGTVIVGTESHADRGVLFVTDHGIGIPEKFHSLIFEKYGQAEMHSQGAQYSSGLGLTFCKLATEASGGQISLESSPGNGATFRVSLPLWSAVTPQ